MHTLNIDSWFINKAKQIRDGRLSAYDTLKARKTALVVVDMQNYFVADGMPACAPEARTIVPNINRLAQALRTAAGTVIWIQTEACIADPQDWANRQEAMSAAGWAKRQALLAGQSGRQAWSVRKLEEQARKGDQMTPQPKDSNLPSKTRRSTHLLDLERQIGQQMGTKVKIRQGRKKGSGTLSIQFYSVDQFDDLLGRLGVEVE